MLNFLELFVLTFSQKKSQLGYKIRLEPMFADF